MSDVDVSCYDQVMASDASPGIFLGIATCAVAQRLPGIRVSSRVPAVKFERRAPSIDIQERR